MSTKIESVADRRLVLANSQVARQLSIGTSWTTLRIGGRFAVDDEGFSIHGNPLFSIGVMTTPASGMTNGPQVASPDHILGVQTATGSISRSTTPVRFTASTVTAGARAFKIVDGTQTNSNLNYGVAFPGEAGYRWPFMVEITKGSPNFTLSFLYTAGTGWTFQDLGDSTLIDAMDSATLADARTVINAAVGTGMSALSITTTLAVNEGTDGNLDSVFVSWWMSYPKLHISELLFYKVA